MRKLAPLLTLVLAALAASGCVERRLTVISSPPGARVYLDGEEMGITPVTFRFDWYGKRTFMLRKDGCRTLREVRDVHEPFYERPVIDIISDLSPLPITDHQVMTFTLEPVREVSREALLDRANETRSRLEGKSIPARGGPTEPRPPVVPPVEPAPEAPAPETTPAEPAPAP